MIYELSSTPEKKPPLSLKTWEEIANISLHSLGLFVSLVGFGILIVMAGLTGSVHQVISSSIYAVTLLLVYVASIMYHSSKAVELPWQKAFEVIDHCAIYLLIAGTYTPYLMVSLQGTVGWIMLALIWSLAFVGITYKVLFFYKSDLLSTLAYIMMGWLCLIVVHPLWVELGPYGFGLLILGGVFYTLGSVFYLLDHTFRFAHAIWHGFVLAGSLAHYFSVIFFVIGPGIAG